MKEKTIEEKAKAYNEFLRKAKELYNRDHHKSKDLEYIFGDDLKEKNERKKLIETLINMFTHKIEKVGEFTNDQIVDWLKEQLEKLEKYEWSGKITSRKAKGKLGELLKELESRKKFDNRPIFRIGDILRKKGKDYTFIVDRIQGGYYFCECNNGAFFPIKEQYNWELLDDGKISPKFKVGDWITDGICTFKISSIDDNYYWSHEGTIGGDIESTNDQYHLWSIEDAKDGDILAAHECYVIFKEIDGLNIRCYCTYHYMNDPSFHTDTLHNKEAFHPATKEECELLYQKAKEAGYWEKECKNNETIEKFIVGKWYLCVKDFFGKGVRFDKGTAYYCAKEGCLQNEYGCHIAIVKDLYDNFKLWAITDAKDGDVLVSTTQRGNQYIYIFRNIENNTIISYIYYCPKLGAVNMGAINMDNTPTVPATKEQQELLFSKIKDEGYKWIAEKLELEVLDYNRNDPSVTKQDLTWSEEDKIICQETIDWFEQKCFPYASEEENPAKKSIQWLKSLKQRMGK